MPKISALPPMTTAADDDEQPIVDKSVPSTKKWTLTLLKTYLQALTGWISNAMLANDTIKGDKINWAATGADNGIWWEELGRTTLGGAADSISVASLPVRKYLRIILTVVPTGTVDSDLRFNNDSGANYSSRFFVNSSAGTSTSATSIPFDSAGNNSHIVSIYDVYNVAARPKLVSGMSTDNSASNAATAPGSLAMHAKWTNTADAITRIDAIQSNTGDFASGTQMVILGHD